MTSWPVIGRVARVWAAEPRAQRAVSLSACTMAVALTRLPNGRHDDESDDLSTAKSDADAVLDMPRDVLLAIM